MDWQHLIMNGENLAEYAALLAAEGLLGHQHANSGWGTFDDDNMVGATAFMETLELALELRRAGYGDERRAPRLRPLPVHRGPGRRREARVLQWRFIDGVAARSTSRRCARPSRRRTPCAPTSWSTRRSAREQCRARRASTSARPASRRSRSRRDGEVLARAEEGYPLSTPQPGWAEQDPEDWWRAAAGGARAAARTGPRIGLSGQMHGLVALDARRRRAAAGDPLERPAHGGRVRRDRGARRARAADRADRQPRADRVHGAEAAVAAHATSPTSTRGSRTCCCPRTTCAAADRRARDRRGRRVGHAALRRRRAGAGARRSATRSRSRSSGCRAGARSRRRSRGAGDQAAGALGVGVDRPGPALGRARHLGRRLRRAARVRGGPRGARARRSATRCPARWHAMGVMLSRGRLAAWLRDALARGDLRGARRGGGRLAARRRGAALPALPRRRAHAARRSRRARRVHRASSLRHDRGALVARGARGRRLRPARLARAPARARRRARGRPRLGRRSAQRRSGSQIVASVLDLPLERTAVEEGAAFGAALLAGVAAGVFADAHEAVERVRPRARAGRARSALARRVRRELRPVPLALPGAARNRRTAK